VLARPRRPRCGLLECAGADVLAGYRARGAIYATENATLRDYFAHRTGLPADTGDLLTQLGYNTDEQTV